MQGRKDYTKEELDHAKTAVDRQLAAYKKLFNNMTLVLDRYFVHRLRVVTGKDGNPLNEVQLLAESLMNHEGVLNGNNVIKFVPDESVVKVKVGDRIELTGAQFERLAKAFFAEIESKFIRLGVAGISD